jgi:predicted adenine nucleotide alpha hydrolase (AANH) superfamily ATPase
MTKPRLLVHACCAPDAAYVIGLLKDTHEVTAFFSNSNIQPASEYERRLGDMRKVAALLGVRLIEDEYNPSLWLTLTHKLRHEPEKGRRCDVCYALRLQRTARTASSLGFDGFTTIMSLSPWKKAAALNRIGRMLGRRLGVRYMEADFKKKDGFRKSVALSRELDLYRQDYCGCVYSRRDRQARMAKRSSSPRPSAAMGEGPQEEAASGHGKAPQK